MIEVKLDAKAMPVPLAYQPIYKIALLLAILRHGCAAPYKATFLKIHLYMWAMRTPVNFRVMRLIQNGTRRTIVPWTPEPGLQRTVTLAIVNELCSKIVSNKQLQIQLTEKGKEVLMRIDEGRYFEEDFSRIKALGVIPQDKINIANDNWDLK